MANEIELEFELVEAELTLGAQYDLESAKGVKDILDILTRVTTLKLEDLRPIKLEHLSLVVGQVAQEIKNHISVPNEK